MSSGKSGIATLLGLRGDKPKVPEFDPIDTGKEQRGAIRDNIKALPLLGKLSEQTTEQMLGMLEQLMPGYKDLLAQGTDQIKSRLAGEIPEDVRRLLEQEAAERGVALGTSGSEFQKYDTLRNLGLTSLKISNDALDSATRWMTMATSRAPFDYGSMFINPMERIGVQQWNSSMRWNREWLNNQLKALPSNEEMAYAQMLDYVADFATMAAGVGMGSVGGGGKMGGGGGGVGGVPGGAGAATSYMNSMNRGA